MFLRFPAQSSYLIARWPIARQKAVDPRVEITNKME